MSPKMSIAILFLVIGISHGGVDPFDAHKAWQDHLDSLAAIDRLYPSRYGLYLKDRAYPITDLTKTPEISNVKSNSSNGVNVRSRSSRSLSTEDTGLNEG